MAETIPLKLMKNGGVPYALADFISTDTINPIYASYDPTGNTYLTGTTVKECLDQSEAIMDFYDQPQETIEDFFSAYVNQIVAITGPTFRNLIAFDTVIDDPRSGFDTVNYKYVIPTKGVWVINALVGLKVTVGNVFDFKVELYVNGVRARNLSEGNYGLDNAESIPIEDAHFSGETTIALDVNDEIQIKLYFDGTIGAETKLGEANSNFAGYLHRELL